MNNIVTRQDINILLSKPVQYEYFLKHLDKPKWFDYLLNELKVFDTIPKPEFTDDGEYTHFPPWWPGVYLEKVADKIPNKVFDVIMKIETDNIDAHVHCAKAILNMPVEFIKVKSNEVVTLFDKWLDSIYPSYVHDLVINLFKKFIDLELFDETCKLFDIISKIKPNKDQRVEFKIESYYIDEIIEKYLPQIIQKRPFAIFEIIEKRFREILECDKTMSEFWRATIEDTDQIRGHGLKDLLFIVLRDTLEKIAEIDSAKTIEIVKKYLNDRNLIFKRLALHIIRIKEFDDLAVSVLMAKKNLYEPDIFHEYVLLMHERFIVLGAAQKNQMIDWILEGPARDKIEDYEAYSRHWKTRWLLNIKGHLESDPDIATRKSLLDEFKDDFSKIDHPDLLTYTTTFTGPQSPVSADRIDKMKPEEFINWAKNEFKPPYEPIIGSPEGVARIFEELVSKNPEKYIVEIEKFMDKDLWPTYIVGLIGGFEKAIKDSKQFNLEPLIQFIENPIKYQPEYRLDESDEEKYYFPIGRYSWLRRAIVDFIETLVRKIEFPITEDIMNRTQKILVDLIERDSNPTVESENKYGPKAKNMNYVTYCMNTNRGKAMIALMHHAWRRNQMRPETDKKEEEGKGPFPPGARMNSYKDFLNMRLEKESSPSVQSSFGYFFTYLYYLDKDWIRQMIKSSYLFPATTERIEFWEAHWQGYIGFNRFYNEIYEILKSQYIKVINNLPDKKSNDREVNQYNERLVEHLMIAFWRNIENINGDDAILPSFFKSAPVALRSHAIKFIADALKETKPDQESSEWQRVKALWKYRIEKAKDEELASFAEWLEYCPETLDETIDLIRPIVPYLRYGYRADEVLNYLNKYAVVCSHNTLLILNDYLKEEQASRAILFRQELIKEILTKVHQHKNEQEVAKGINKTVNLLVIMGYYDFQEFLIE